MAHDFARDVRDAARVEAAPWWSVVYRRFWAGYDGHSVVGYGNHPELQRAGVDHVVKLKSGRPANVDVKTRHVDYPDFALEVWSDKERKADGWIQRPNMLCHYLAYAVLPRQECHLFPFQQLQQAWVRMGGAWSAWAETRTRGFRIVDADNGSYVTRSVAVPIAKLLDEVPLARSTTWSRRGEQPLYR